jgi:prepilin-type N-terminal cleavage/methylation domain-containing protein
MTAGGDKGFTLIELLIVVVVIGILASIAIPKFSRVRERSYIASVTLDLKNLAAQQEIFHGDNMTYASSLAAISTMSVTSGVNLVVNEADPRGWAATGWHDAFPGRQCGIYYGAASAANGVPAPSAGIVVCQP